jgi:glycosyltransferase involved in cell wall biosynthesis
MLSTVHITAVAATAADLRTSTGRVVWDRQVYDSLIRWRAESVRPARRELLIGRGVRIAARAATRVAPSSDAYRRSRTGRAFGTLGQLRWFDVDEDVEVLYGNIVYPRVPARRLPVVWSTQGVVPGAGRTPEASVLTHEDLIRRAQVTQCWSQRGLDGLLARSGDVERDRVRVVPPLVYVDLPPRIERGNSDLEVLFVGGDGRLKGLAVALAAAQAFGPGVRLSVVTEDPQPDGLPSNVRWLGPLPRRDVLGLLQAVDVHLFLSRVESFGVVAVEAMAAGVAQVVDRDGVPAEVAGAGAVAVDGRDAGEVLAALEMLADNRVRLAHACEGRRRYETTYSPDAVGPQIEALIDAAFGGDVSRSGQV